jgi:ElaB/YqjD/DUF883 family membrane-anchored ribosome-binding protein
MANENIPESPIPESPLARTSSRTEAGPGKGAPPSPSRSGTQSAASADSSGSDTSIVSKLADSAQQTAQQAAEGLTKTASSLASDTRDRMKALLSEKVASGAEFVGQVAGSTRRTADDLERNSPQISGLLRDASARMDEFSRTLHAKSVDELVETASRYARRQPAMLFGAAAVAGFALFRLLKAGSEEGSMRRVANTGGLAERRIHDSPSVLPEG